MYVYVSNEAFVFQYTTQKCGLTIMDEGNQDDDGTSHHCKPEGML